MKKKEIWRSLDSALFGSMFGLYRANKTLQKLSSECRIEHFSTDERLRCSKKSLENMLELSIGRLERIETKAMGTLLGVAVAIAIFGATSGLLGADGLLTNRHYFLQLTVAVFLIADMLYLLGSGLLALEAYRVGQVFRPVLTDYVPIVDETREKAILLYAIEQNERAATLRSNRLSASFTCLRNGLIVVLVLGAIIVGASLIPPSC